MQEVCEREVVLAQKVRLALLDDGRAIARKHRSDAAENLFVYHSDLCEVRYFGSATDICEIRKKEVFHHRTKQHVRTETLRMLGNAGFHLVG